MNADQITPQEAARGALRAGLPLAGDRHEVVASTAGHVHSVIALLRELDFGETPPAMSYSAGPVHATGSDFTAEVSGTEGEDVDAAV
ncbi:hypothetical protein [Streptomyces sp. NPDC057302]|uniref:hypothetical protein n=1 Tax=Streptomyces sp. NPDC057302 TaxID=3346094 RepID=UPI00363799A2